MTRIRLARHLALGALLVGGLSIGAQPVQADITGLTTADSPTFAGLVAPRSVVEGSEFEQGPPLKFVPSYVNTCQV